ncbi:thioredoxin family protein [Aquabacterium sp.]|uniref:thioredoxin family protein n=1 Tax=Aquabacterium sp. TaxID=1872578 RepID=UPI0025BED008|nr:thioredoxin family protein [Aquabacterium sp.]
MKRSMSHPWAGPALALAATVALWQGPAGTGHAADATAAGPLSGQGAPTAPGTALRAAPPLVGLGPWFNSPPLNLQALRGKVVLVDFWTHGCSNCINTLPHVQAWHQRYKDQGLVVIGVHTPEFPSEREAANVQAAIRRHGLGYPIAMDNDFRTWEAWRNAYWPALYLIDKQGRVVFQHVGEGAYERTEARIQEALRAP